MESTEREPTISDVLAELRGVEARLTKRIDDIENGQTKRIDTVESWLEAGIQTLQTDINAVDAKIDEAGIQTLRTDINAVDAKVDAVRHEVEVLGRDTRAGWAALKRDLPQAVVAAVDRTFGAELRALREEVDELKEAAG